MASRPRVVVGEDRKTSTLAGTGAQSGDQTPSYQQTDPALLHDAQFMHCCVRETPW